MTDILRKYFWSGSIRISGVILAFLFFVISARLLSLEDYGLFATYLSLATLIGFIVSAGQQVIVIKYWNIVEDTEGASKADYIILRSLKIITGSFLVVAALCISSYTLWSHQRLFEVFNGYEDVVALLLFSLAFGLSEFIQAALRAKGDYFLSQSGREILWRLVCIILFVLIPDDAVSFRSFIVISFSTLILISALQLATIIRDLRLSTPATKDMRNTVYNSTIWYWVSTAIGPISTHSSSVIVGFMVSPMMAGPYFAADRLSKLLAIALVSVNQVYGPSASKLYHQKNLDKLQRLTSVSTLFSAGFAAVTATFFLVFGDIALRFFSDSFEEYYDILVILVIGQSVNVVCGPMSTLMDMAGLERSNAKILIFFGIIGPSIQAIAAYHFGIYGVAISSSFCLAAWSVLRLYYCYKFIGVIPLKLNDLLWIKDEH